VRVIYSILHCVCLSASPSVGCKPKSVGLKADGGVINLRGNRSDSNSTSAGNSSVMTDAVALSNESASLFTPLSACVWSIPVLYEEVDVLSLRFTPATGPNVSVTDAHPTLLTYPLYTQATGGTLNLQLTLNTVSTTDMLHIHSYTILITYYILDLRVSELCFLLFYMCVCVCVCVD